MPVYVWQAKDKSGNTIFREVEAGTAKESQDILLADGYTDLSLKEEDVMSAVRAGFAGNKGLFGEDVKSTPQQRDEYHTKAAASFTSVLFNAFKKNYGFFSIITCLAVWQGYRGNWISVSLLILALLALIVFFLYLGTALINYQKLIKASDWHNWDEVLSLIKSLKTVGKFSFVKVPDSELIRFQAKAIVGKGKLAEGLEIYKQCEGRADCPSWLYKLFVGGLHVLAKEYDKAIEYNIASIAEKSTPTAWADLSYRYARYKRDPVRARQAMAEADKEPVAELIKPHRARCIGVIAYLEGEYTAAKNNLEACIEMIEKVPNRPFRDGHLSIARAYLCCVFAKQKNISAAEKCFNQAKAYLVATDETELLAECQQLIGRQ